MAFDLRREFVATALSASFAMASMVAIPPAEAAQPGSMQLNVVARILPMVRVRMLHQPETIEITRQDVERGFIEAPAAAMMQVTTNTPWEVSFHRSGNLIGSARVRGLPAEVVVGPEGGSRAVLAVMRTPTDFQLSYRFHLAPEAQPGTYPWPLVVSVQGR